MASLLSLRPQSLHNARRIVSQSSPLVLSQLRLHSRSLLPSNLQPSTQLPAPRTYSAATAQAVAPAVEISRANEPPPTVSSRWLSDVKERVGKCIMFGMNAGQVRRAGEIMKVLASDWIQLSVGAEGYLTGKGREEVCEQTVSWGEMDAMGHVNNGTYVRWAESARINWMNNFGMHHYPEHKEDWQTIFTPKGDGVILRSLKLDYKIPMIYPDKVSVYHKLRDAPTSDTEAFILDTIIISSKSQRVAARCTEDIVMYDYRANKKMKLAPFVAKAFIETYRLQEEAKKVNTEKILVILSAVETLEKETWNRSDAKEDLGSGV